VSHNFGLSLLGYGYVTITFLSLLTTTFILYVLSLFMILNKYYQLFLIKSFFSNKKKFNIINFKNMHILNYLFIFLVTYLYWISFNPIVNNIFWTTLNIEILNIIFSFVNLKFLLLILVYFYLYTLPSWVLLTYLYHTLGLMTSYTPILIYYVRYISINYLFHILLIILFYGSIYLQNTIFIQWKHYASSHTNWYSIYFRNIYRNNILTENINVTTVINPLYKNLMYTPNSFFWFQSSLDAQFFSLELDQSLLRQVIYNHSYLYVFNVSIYDIASSIVDLIFTIVLLFTCVLFFIKHKIIF
jgi:hypothetical protein